MKEVVFLRELGEEHLNRISRMAQVKEYEPDAVVFRQGQDSPSIYIVLKGQVSVRMEEAGGASVEVSLVGPGELLGWSPVLGRQAMTATARAVKRSRLAVLDVHQVLDLCERDPRFGIAFLRQIALVLSERLWGTRRYLARALSHRPLHVGPLEGSD
jgi:CRP-like cAMP-binding protein